jgi:hypothetical protein
MTLWVISALGCLVIAGSLLPFSARLKPLQGAGIALGLIFVVLPWLPPGTYSFWGGSYERAAETQVIATTNEQFNRMSARVAALERRVSLSERPSTTTADRRAAQDDDRRARQRYTVAAREAAAARSRYIQTIGPDVTATLFRWSGQSPGSDAGISGSAPTSTDSNTTIGTDDHGEPCCTAITEPIVDVDQ